LARDGEEKSVGKHKRQDNFLAVFADDGTTLAGYGEEKYVNLLKIEL